MPKNVTIRVKRRPKPDASEHWERFSVAYEPGLNITSCLQRIAADPVTTDGVETTPVAYDACCLEEVCGACSMLINGRVRQACSALVDNLFEEAPDEVTLEPMTKFPVIRDLLVDRSRMFSALTRSHAWIDVDGYYDRGSGLLVPPATQEVAYPLSKCMTCGCCVEACPQYNDKSDFIGPAAVSQIVMFNDHPSGKASADRRLDVLLGAEGIANCGNAQNCVEVCPKDIPLTDSIARAGRQATIHAIRRFFDR